MKIENVISGLVIIFGVGLVSIMTLFHFWVAEKTPESLGRYKNLTFTGIGSKITPFLPNLNFWPVTSKPGN